MSLHILFGPVCVVLLLQVLSVLSARYPSALNFTKLTSNEQGEDDGTDRDILLVDARGPNRLTGDGVRFVGMLADLQKCSGSKKLAVLSDWDTYGGVGSILKEWDTKVRTNVLDGVKFWTLKDFKQGNIKLDSYKRILIGAKLDLTHIDDSVVNAVTNFMSKEPAGWRSRVSVFWDDMPFERCKVKPNASDWCPRVPAFVKTHLSFANKFFVLTPEDQSSFQKALKAHNMDSDRLTFDIWPMRIENMAKLFPAEHYNVDKPSKAKNLVLMMGNHHPVNSKNLKLLFSGVVTQVCDAIEKSNSNIKLMFIGEMSMEVEKIVKKRAGGKHNYACVSYTTGFVTQHKLETEILPKTRAFLNPFLFDVHSGISVKSYEAIMQGFPLVTSKFGMLGLNSVHECNQFPMPEDPTSTKQLTHLILSKVIDEEGYEGFSRSFQTTSKQCQDSQMARYPVHRICD